MTVLYDADISGDGVDLMAGTNVIFAVWHLTTIDPLVRTLEPSAPDHLLRAGWFAFGDSLSVIGGVSAFYWQPPQWMDWVDGLWTPNPNTVAGAATSQYGPRLRWHFNGTTAGHIYIYGP